MINLREQKEAEDRRKFEEAKEAKLMFEDPELRKDVVCEKG